MWDLSVINNWVEQYPTEYSHACSLGIDRKTVASDKENVQLFEKLYSEDLYLKNNDSYTNAIRTCIKEQNGFAIVLGAGVSKEQGAKTWDELLKDFQKEIEEKHLLDDSKAVFEEVGKVALQRLSYARISGQVRKPLLGRFIKAYMMQHGIWI